MKNILCFIFLLTINFSLIAQDQNSSVSSVINSIIEIDDSERTKKVAGQDLFSSVVIRKFYSDRTFFPAWSDGDILPELAYEMRYEIKQVQFDGLNPQDYHLRAIDELFDKYEQSKKGIAEFSVYDFASLDILLSDAYIIISSHLYLGKIDPENLKSSWDIQRSAPELMIDQRLHQALLQQSIRKSLEELYPSFQVYKKMRDALRFLYDDLARWESEKSNNWKKLKIDKSVKVGDSYNQLDEVKDRLKFWGFLSKEDLESGKQYDSLLVPAITKLQIRHGMEPDGVIGQGTIHALNQSPLDLIETARVNMERFRWLPRDVKDQEVILVNTANFQLDYISKRDTVLSSKVIVGKSYHATPQFSAEMSYMVFSPTWTIPNSITRNEIIPAVKKDIGYLRSKNMKILTSDGKEVDPQSIDWQKANGKNFPYMVRQEPGDQNSLGLVKFMFPNKHSVYIHDTPARSLFAREDRALSHGCIRIQRPFDFAKVLLKHDSSWTDDKIKESMKKSKEVIVKLDRKIPVVILYMTFWADSRGNNFFRKDIYDRDNEILEALKQTRGKKSGV
ncbi:murein L,D-transpeptidase [Belliella kenyensis]|uniref:Murein L,D-transpeptidase n=1 Tax=Belliella kenyensis TaxID=1472724 RepID=A0ABV8EKB0_9BACT|nr:L,D-transpeptidase family protein [Belliella kenyensis]MCH7403100.1 L,D-transpeptidase family protein [Belliella kenyensis]MDN3602269.1 L,D-transpeptidase family protein [Belliella kenyensis]